MTLENEGHTYRWPEPKDPGIIEFGRVVVTETEIEVSGWHVRDMTVPSCAHMRSSGPRID